MIDFERAAWGARRRPAEWRRLEIPPTLLTRVEMIE
jgi:hypothetical protein